MLPRRAQALKRFASTVQKIENKVRVQDVANDATIFSMIQPTGKFHLGNYLGAARVWKDLCDVKQDDQKLLYGVADLHAITVPKPEVEQFRQLRMEAIASILSCGVDPSKASVMFQSSIPQHSQLHWLLSTFANMGYLNRMTQWKTKSNIRDSEAEAASLGKVKLGLFSYPVLQAADILIYKATHVPVGDDQSQHLELTRHLAEQFNSFYKTEFFPVPTTILAPTRKILSLASTAKKMSKSDANQDSVIYLNDEPDMIAKKIRKAVTDSMSDHFNYDPVNRPGVSNLINIVSGVLRVPTSDIDREIQRFNNFKDFKAYVTEVVIEELREPRTLFKQYMNEKDFLEGVVKEGTEKAAAIAEKNMKDIMNIMGF